MKSKKTSTSINPTDVILDNLLDAVLIVDEDGIIVYANKSAEKMFCKPSSKLLKQSFGFPITAYTVQEIQVIKDFEILTVQMLASVITWNETESFLLSLRDITQQKITEAELDEERRKLQITSIENEQYASMASHDLKEPVRKILIYSNKLLTTSLEITDEKANEYLTKINNSAMRMKTLLGGIAEYSQISKNKKAFKPVDLSATVAEVCLDLEILIKEKSVLVIYESLPVIDAVPVQIHQLFLNLVSNAIKYSKEDVPPEIMIKMGDADEKLVEILVIDNGIGFENAYAEKVFQPFARVHSGNYDGSGIGLAICKKIVEAHGGTISVSSMPSNGSEFKFSILKKHHNI